MKQLEEIIARIQAAQALAADERRKEVDYACADLRELFEMPKRPGGKSYRSAATGQFVGKGFADENPDTTVSERRR